jgi:hypothetical protein
MEHRLGFRFRLIFRKRSEFCVHVFMSLSSCLYVSIAPCFHVTMSMSPCLRVSMSLLLHVSMSPCLCLHVSMSPSPCLHVSRIPRTINNRTNGDFHGCENHTWAYLLKQELFRITVEAAESR